MRMKHLLVSIVFFAILSSCATVQYQEDIADYTDKIAEAMTLATRNCPIAPGNPLIGSSRTLIVTSSCHPPKR